LGSITSKDRKGVVGLKKKSVTGWSIQLEWSDGKTEEWSDCDSYFDTQVVDDGITEYEGDKSA